jgi:predicted enzyme related to lactoylglutathione lyase
MLRPVHFEITATDPEAAVRFYESVFGWKAHRWEGPMDYWLITTGENGVGINGGLARRQEGMPANTTNTIDVPSVDEYVAKVTEAGGRIIFPKTAVPGVGWLAYAEDPQGTTFGMMQNDPSAG